MNESQIIWVGRHEGLLRDVSRGCAYGDALSLKQGARILSAFVKDGSVLVPMPSHIGYATTMLSLCRCLKSYGSNLKICDCLICEPHESSHIAKLHGGIAPKVRMHLNSLPPTEGKVYIIDNNISSGNTARAALEVYSAATVLAITKGNL